ncbi:MAG: hypothetical protein RHS_6125 [Robinsoniella sp. RHS]|nr:MAG: hypothetical protein RHS_6125 [Robinsoniella sp. RHS]
MNGAGAGKGRRISNERAYIYVFCYMLDYIGSRVDYMFDLCN